VAARGSDLQQSLGRLLPLSSSMSSKYRGRHYVEVYVVKNGQVVASNHHDVVIK
jgi:hypothetical protein